MYTREVRTSLAVSIENSQLDTAVKVSGYITYEVRISLIVGMESCPLVLSLGLQPAAPPPNTWVIPEVDKCSLDLDGVTCPELG
jgi:hypothetical protein